MLRITVQYTRYLLYFSIFRRFNSSNVAAELACPIFGKATATPVSFNSSVSLENKQLIKIYILYF